MKTVITMKTMKTKDENMKIDICIILQRAIKPIQQSL